MDSVADVVDQVRVRVGPSGLVDRPNAALALQRKVKTLADWKLKGIGPRPIMVGGRVFYDWQEVLAMARGEKPITPPMAPV